VNAAATAPLSRSVEDYLKAIYHLSLDGEPAGTSRIAEVLDVAPPSVSGMIRRLSDLGILSYEPYRGVELTEEGRRVALVVIRRHRIIEAYLVARLGYSWDTVHEEAERLEHAVSDVLVERMALALGNPEFDPHGDPIPDSQGRMTEVATVPLSEVPAGEAVQVKRVDAGEADRLRYIGDAGLVPGSWVEVIRREPFDGPVTIRTGGRERVIGFGMANLVHCARPRGGPAA